MVLFAVAANHAYCTVANIVSCKLCSWCEPHLVLYSSLHPGCTSHVAPPCHIQSNWTPHRSAKLNIIWVCKAVMHVQRARQFEWLCSCHYRYWLKARQSLRTRSAGIALWQPAVADLALARGGFLASRQAFVCLVCVHTICIFWLANGTSFDRYC